MPRAEAGKSGQTTLSGDGLTSQAALHLLRRTKDAILTPRCPLS